MNAPLFDVLNRAILEYSMIVENLSFHLCEKSDRSVLFVMKIKRFMIRMYFVYGNK